MTAADFAGDVPLDLATRAHSGTSHTPERRGEQERDGYAATLAGDYAALEALADTEERRTALASSFARYREGYRVRTLAQLAAKARCVSTMIAGPARFPVRRQEKLGNTADRRTAELVEYRERALRAIRRELGADGGGPIMAGDSDATTRLRAKLGGAEAAQERMKLVNGAIRRHAAAGWAAQVAALVALGLGEAEAKVRLVPDELGRVGFADYEVKNNGAEIRRLRARLAGVERDQAAPAAAAAGEHARLEDVPAENRVRLYFPGKPDEATRSTLKAGGFRWTPSLGCWQAYRNHNAIELARRTAGVKEPTCEP